VNCLSSNARCLSLLDTAAFTSDSNSSGHTHLQSHPNEVHCSLLGLCVYVCKSVGVHACKIPLWNQSDAASCHNQRYFQTLNRLGCKKRLISFSGLQFNDRLNHCKAKFLCLNPLRFVEVSINR